MEVSGILSGGYHLMVKHWASAFAISEFGVKATKKGAPRLSRGSLGA